MSTMDQMKQYLSQRAHEHVKELPFMMKAHFDALNDLFSEENQNGFINLGTAENRLIDEKIVDILKDLQNKLVLTPEHVHYNLFYGSTEFREAIAKHWGKVWLGESRKSLIDAENIVVTCGCSEAIEMLAYGLCSRGDIILLPTPYYSGFEHDIQSRAGVIPVGVDCGNELSINAFEYALEKQRVQGKTVRAVLLSNPNNPTGHVYSPEALKNVVDFCINNKLDLISDEIYAQTIFEPDTQYTSMLSLVPETYMHRVHILGGFAKDFSLSGFRVGFCHSYNIALISFMREMSYFSSVSSHTQAVLTELLKSDDIETFIEENKKIIFDSYQYISTILSKYSIRVEPAQGGVFLLADMSQFMSQDTVDEALKLTHLLYEKHKINMLPGHIFGTSPSLFRICYAHSKLMMDEFDRRLSKLFADFIA
nr:pyridoxal phosphate-dependent aminotransferase [Acinetobacter sp. Marseille-Q1620]